MTSCQPVPGSAVGAIPSVESPVSMPTNASSASASWPALNGYDGSSCDSPQNPGWKRPKVWPSSWPPYQSPYEPSLSQPQLFDPVGPDATVAGSGVPGIPAAEPRMKPPPSDTKP